MAMAAISPAAAVSLIPMAFPSFINGFRSSLVITYTSGNAPASTMAISPTTSNPSEMGAIPGIRVNPVNSFTMMAANPTVITATTPLPKAPKPRIMAFSAFQSPKAMSPPISTMGSTFRRTIPTGNPATRPAATTPRGMVTMPHRMPLAMAGRSSSVRIPMATGMMNTTVAPSMDPVMTPPSMAA